MLQPSSCKGNESYSLTNTCAYFLTADNGFLEYLESLLTNRRAEEHHALLTWTVQVRATIVYCVYYIVYCVYYSLLKLLCVL